MPASKFLSGVRFPLAYSMLLPTRHIHLASNRLPAAFRSGCGEKPRSLPAGDGIPESTCRWRAMPRPLGQFAWRWLFRGVRPGAVIGTGLVLVLIACGGCSDEPDSMVDLQRSNSARLTDPGHLSGDPIARPYLTDIEPVETRNVVLRFGDGSMLVQNQRNDPIEIVPRPEPDSKPATQPESRPTREPQGSETGPAATSDQRRGDPDDSSPAPPKSPSVNGEPVRGAATAPLDYQQWPTPDVALVVTGRQHGYLEPCGCTGLDRQKGGMARRFTLMRQLNELGWTLLPVDAGDQVRRFGPQAEIKLQQTARALREMDYKGVGFGPDDLRLGVGELLSVAAAEDLDEAMYVSANVVLIDPTLMPKARVVAAGGHRIGITSILDPQTLDADPGAGITVEPMVEAARDALQQLQQERASFNVLLFFGAEESGQKLAKQVPGFDLIVAAGSYGEPTYQPLPSEGSESEMIFTGDKGMYAGLVGIYSDAPFKYARVALTHEFADAPEMRRLMADYQAQLKALGLEKLGLLPPVPHSSGQRFVGSAVCGDCHTTAMAVWEGSRHAEATADIIQPPKERGDIARHFDPECLSCHVTGWNPQEYFPYASGYLSLEESAHLTGNGCENCHGPGSQHAAAELGDLTVTDEVRDQFRAAMRLPLEKAREKCLSCHDLDNSPDFHEADAFEDVYWPEVEHYGVD